MNVGSPNQRHVVDAGRALLFAFLFHRSGPTDADR
jgi:hypothetical protein